jgi:hypothetical protein
MNSDDIKRSIGRLKGLEWIGSKAKENDKATNIAVRALTGVEDSISDIKEEINKYKRRNTQTPYEIGVQVGIENALKMMYKNLDYKDDEKST